MSQASKNSDRSRKSGKWIYPRIAGGLPLGLSVPSFSFLPLGFLAWAWCVPLLFELKRARNFSSFLKRVSVTVGVGFSLITLLVVNEGATVLTVDQSGNIYGGGSFVRSITLRGGANANQTLRFYSLSIANDDSKSGEQFLPARRFL